MAPQSTDSKSTYQNNEKVLCFHGEFLYEAKIQDLRRTDTKDPKSPFEFKIHYKGWKNTWDDWVSFERLRKWTDENRELAAQLRREHTQAQKAQSKTTSKSRRGLGSELGSGRGSEERTSSVPAAGRGSKRARDNDIEKVSKVSPRTMTRMPRDENPFGSLHLLDTPHDPASLPGWDFMKDSPGHKPVSGDRKPVGTPTVSPITPDIMDQDQAVEEQEDVKTTSVKGQEANNTDDLRRYVYQPRRASTAAATAIRQSVRGTLLDNIGTATARGKRKAREDSPVLPAAKRPTPGFRAGKQLGGSIKRSLSPRLSSMAKKPRPVGTNGVAVRVTRNAEVARLAASRLSAARRSAANKASRPFVVPTSEFSASTSSIEDEETPHKDLTAPDQTDTESEDEYEPLTSSVDYHARKSSATTARGRVSKSISFDPELNGNEYEGDDEDLFSSIDRNVRETSAKTTRVKSTSKSKSTIKLSERDFELSEDESPAKDKDRRRSARLSNGKSTMNATSSSSRVVRSTAAPSRVIGTHRQSISAPKKLDKTTVKKNRSAAQKKEQPPKIIMPGERYLSGVVRTYPTPRNGNQETFNDIPLQEINGILTAAEGFPIDDLQIEPPGSGTPLDALNYPQRLLDKVNSSAVAFPEGWADDAINSIPDEIFVDIRISLLSILRYDLLVHRPWPLLKTLPDSSPFWDTWEKYQGRPIIDAFVAKVKSDNQKDSAKTVVKDEPSPTTTGLNLLADACEIVRSRMPPPAEAPLVQASQDVEMHIQPALGSNTSLDHVPEPMQPRAPVPAQIPHATGREAHFPGLHALAQELPACELNLELGEPLTYMVLLPQEDSFYSRPSIRIAVPDHLKNLLVDDWENVTKSLLLVPLPSQAPANYIIDAYFNEEKMNRRLESADADVLEEFCAGLKMYFEKAVGKILLYRFERSQLAEVRKLWESGKHKEWDGKGPGDCYGAEHLTRMIVNLPEMIAQTNMDAEAVSRLKTELSKFSTWLSRNSAKYFCAKYEKPSTEYIEAAR